MANLDLQSFLESRLLALHPEEDVSSGSAAQTRFIQPVLNYMGTDPFETDIAKFIEDRFAQEFPDIYANDPGAIRDVFINPLKLLLTPFKREIQYIKNNQSLADPTLLSDDDADALAANYFSIRNAGSIASGVVRVYFANPSDQSIDITSRVYSVGNLNFFPSSSVTITAESMAYNRDGSLFYLDIPVQAEKTGSEYNLDIGQIIGMDGLSVAVAVTNLSKFYGGSSRQDTQSFITATETALAEQSLVTRRGASARLSKTFQGQIRDLQVIGARDEEMQRDILVATSPGHAWITGSVNLFNKVAFVKARTIDGASSDAPKPGDTLYVYLPKSWSTSTQATSRFIRLVVDELLLGPSAVTDTNYEFFYFVRWSDPNLVLDSIFVDDAAKGRFFEGLGAVVLEGGFAKKGDIRIDSVAGVPDSSNVPNQTVHMFGHTDVYVRPVSQEFGSIVIDGLYDLGAYGSTTKYPHFSIERPYLETTSDSNSVWDRGQTFDFEEAGVRVGDKLTVESGQDAGTYTVLKVDSTTLYLDQVLQTTSTGDNAVRYRIARDVRINPFEPKLVRFPFGDYPRNILNTTIGESLVSVDSSAQVDLINLGVQVGDTLRILDGPDVGDYSVVSFNSNLNGKGVYLDRALTSTASFISFEVFTKFTPVPKPLVRIKDMYLLDSAKQSTGISVPPADPVAVRPIGPMSSAKVLGASQLPNGFILPDFDGLLTNFVNTAVVAPNVGRYSSGLDVPDGIYVSTTATTSTGAFVDELDLRSDTSGKCSFFMAAPDTTTNSVNKPAIDPKPGECLTLKDGPSKGSYLIRNVYKLKYTTVSGANDTLEHWVYFIQIYGAFPVDPLKQLINFINIWNGSYGLEFGSLSFPLTLPGTFSSWYAGLGDRFRSALRASGVSEVLEATELQAIIESMTRTKYEWGYPARGVLRTYFREPTLFEQRTADSQSPTTYSFLTPTEELIKFRPDPNLYTKQELVPPRATEDTKPLEYPRDLSIPVQSPTTSINVAFENTRLSLFGFGVAEGDYLSVHEEIFSNPARASSLSLSPKYLQYTVQTVENSQAITIPSCSSDEFSSELVGTLVFIEEGKDTDGYTVSKLVSPKTILLDRVLTYSTPVITSQGSGSVQEAGGNNRLTSNTVAFSAADVDSYVTVFGLDYRRMGSYQISSVDPNGLYVEVAGSVDFPTVASSCFWVITQSEKPPQSVSRDSTYQNGEFTGTTLVGVVPIRIYKTAPRDFSLIAVSTDVYDSVCSISYTAGSNFNIVDGIGQPYRFYRPDVRRVTSSEMAANKEDALFYFDTSVVSLSPSQLANIGTGSYLSVDSGTYTSTGYRHLVADPSYTYSVKEDGFLELPLQVLPVGSDDAPDSFISLVGAPLQINYDKSDLVKEIQDFLDSSEDRVASANMLARHLLPAYTSYFATYSNGAEPSTIAAEIFKYIETLAVAQTLDVSELESIIVRYNGNPDTPTNATTTIHDWDRRMWAEFSVNKLENLNSVVPYSGSSRVTHFIPGPFVSADVETPDNGERITLTRK
jgi:hypothetical protein